MENLGYCWSRLQKKYLATTHKKIVFELRLCLKASALTETNKVIEPPSQRMEVKEDGEADSFL